MREVAGKPVRTLVVWEPVLVTDWTRPSTATMGRMSDARAVQFWDKPRLVSHMMGEHDRKSLVWDWVGVYKRGAEWSAGPPEAFYHGGPVVRVVEEARSALAQALVN